MKTFFAAFLGVLAAGALLFLAPAVLGPEMWQSRGAQITERLRGNDRRTEAAAADSEAKRIQTQRRRANREEDELQTQRRERLALLTATLGTKPVARLAAAETHLFQQAEREQARASSDGLYVRLLEPVQIDESTVLQRGTAVELLAAERDNVITIRHDGARYRVSPCQTELRAVIGAVCEE